MLVMNHEASPGFYNAVEDYRYNTDGMYVLVINGTRFENHNNVSFSLDGLAHRELRCEAGGCTSQIQSTHSLKPPGFINPSASGGRKCL
jgi:hypothetical protein